MCLNQSYFKINIKVTWVSLILMTFGILFVINILTPYKINDICFCCMSCVYERDFSASFGERLYDAFTTAACGVSQTR